MRKGYGITKQRMEKLNNKYIKCSEKNKVPIETDKLCSLTVTIFVTSWWIYEIDLNSFS